MYRIVTLAVLRTGIDPDDVDGVGAAAADVELAVGYDPNEDRSYLAGEDVSAEIRGDEVTKAVSAVSAVSAVRTRLVLLPRGVAPGPGERGVAGPGIWTGGGAPGGPKDLLSAPAHVRAPPRDAP